MLKIIFDPFANPVIPKPAVIRFGPIFRPKLRPGRGDVNLYSPLPGHRARVPCAWPRDFKHFANNLKSA